MADLDTTERLVAHGVITRELAQRAAQIPLHVASSRIGRLIAAGAEPTQLLESVSRLTGIPVAPVQLVDWATAVHLLPSTAHKLRDTVACPVQRDAQGTLHVVVADPESLPALEKLLVGFKVYLAPEAKVRTLLQDLYKLSPIPDAALDTSDAVDIDLDASRRNAPAPGPAPEAIDIDLEASRRMSPAPSAPGAQSGAPIAPAAPLVDPFGARPSGKFKRPKDEEETMRIQRAPGVKPSAPAPAPTPVSQAPVTVLDERTIEDGTAPVSIVSAMKEREQRAFVRGAVVGASITAVIAALIVLALIAAR